MSVFPAAITLAENDFNLGYLLDQPGYLDGGPNVHSISIITWLTALVFALLGPGPALLPTLHLIHFLIAAMAFTGLFRLSEIGLGRKMAAAIVIAALTVPVVFTQVGSMYLEIPLLAAAVYATLAWHRNRPFLATALLAVAVLIKGSGVFFAGALALAPLLSTGAWPKRFRSAVLLLFPSLIIGLFLVDEAVVDSSFNFHVFRAETVGYLLRIPDVLLLIVLLAVVAALAIVREIRRADDALASERSGPVLTTSVLFLVAFVGFYYVLLPLTGKYFSVLPRYYTVVIPFLILGLTTAACRLGVRRLAFGGLTLLLLVSIVNRNGTLYADNELENFALIERSGAYADLLDLQRVGMAELARAAADLPAFYTHVEHYRFSYPQMGHVDQSIPVGYNLNTDEPYSEGDLSEFPDEFVMLHEWNWLGGEVVRDVWKQALEDPRRSVHQRSLSVGEYRSTLITVSTN